MDEEQNNNVENVEEKVENVTEISTEPVTPVEVPTEAPLEQPTLEQSAAANVEPTTIVDVNSVNTEEKKKNNKLIPIIGLLVLLAGVFAGLYFCTDIFKGNDKDKGKEEDKPVQQDTSLSSKYVGIYTAKEDNMYIHKKTDDEFYYTIGGNFQGVAKVEGETAKEENLFGDSDSKYFEFKLVDGGIEVIYHAGENESVAADTGLYKKVADYSKDNVYKYAVGDPKYLTEKYSGVFKNGDIEFRLIQKNDKEVMVDLVSNDISNLPLFNETFEIKSDNHLVAKSFFDESKIAYEITFTDKAFTFKTHTDVFGVDDDTKKLEKTFTFSKALTQDEIIEEYFSYY